MLRIKETITLLSPAKLTISTCAGYVICFTGMVICLFAFFPGYMSNDSLASLSQGRSGNFLAISSPVMSLLWGQLDSLVPGPLLMLCLHTIIFWSAALLFWVSAKTKSAKLAMYLACVGFLPQILSQLSTIWKDVGLGVSLLLASALLYHSSAMRSKLSLAVSPVFLLYAYAIRLNALTAVFPIAIWTAFVFFEIFPIRITKISRNVCATLLGFCYFLVLSAAVVHINRSLVQSDNEFPFQQVLLYDLAAISTARDEALFPDYITSSPHFSMEDVNANYGILSVNRLIYGRKPILTLKNAEQNKTREEIESAILKLSNDPNEIAALRATWKQVMLGNKTLYLLHRSKVFAQLLAVPPLRVSSPYALPDTNPPPYYSTPNLLTNLLFLYFEIGERLLFFSHFVFFILNVVLIVGALRSGLHGEWRIVFFLSLSSLLYTVAYFPIAPTTEFRLVFWSELASAVALGFGIYLRASQLTTKTEN